MSNCEFIKYIDVQITAVNIKPTEKGFAGNSNSLIDRSIHPANDRYERAWILSSNSICQQ